MKYLQPAGWRSRWLPDFGMFAERTAASESIARIIGAAIQHTKRCYNSYEPKKLHGLIYNSPIVENPTSTNIANVALPTTDF
jgi:hypothetical protein